jgi:hypothetical protein
MYLDLTLPLDWSLSFVGAAGHPLKPTMPSIMYDKFQPIYESYVPKLWLAAYELYSKT